MFWCLSVERKTFAFLYSDGQSTFVTLVAHNHQIAACFGGARVAALSGRDKPCFHPEGSGSSRLFHVALRRKMRFGILGAGFDQETHSGTWISLWEQ